MGYRNDKNLIWTFEEVWFNSVYSKMRPFGWFSNTKALKKVLSGECNQKDCLIPEKYLIKNAKQLIQIY